MNFFSKSCIFFFLLINNTCASQVLREEHMQACGLHPNLSQLLILVFRTLLKNYSYIHFHCRSSWWRVHIILFSNLFQHMPQMPLQRQMSSVSTAMMQPTICYFFYLLMLLGGSTFSYLRW